MTTTAVATTTTTSTTTTMVATTTMTTATVTTTTTTTVPTWGVRSVVVYSHARDPIMAHTRTTIVEPLALTPGRPEWLTHSIEFARKWVKYADHDCRPLAHKCEELRMHHAAEM